MSYRLHPLEDILQDLINYCRNNTTEEVKLKIKLPKSVLGQYSLSYKTKEKIKLSGNIEDLTVTLSAIHLNGGSVELES